MTEAIDRESRSAPRVIAGRGLMERCELEWRFLVRSELVRPSVVRTELGMSAASVVPTRAGFASGSTTDAFLLRSTVL
jgi:hypothetical protein